jgi:membrane protease YdiL (CAAX protease family)
VQYFRELWRDARKTLTAAPDLLVIAVVCAFVLTFSRYTQVRIPGLDPRLSVLTRYLFTNLLYVAVPLLSLIVLRIRPAALGLSPGNARLWLRDVGLLYLAMLPLLFFAARQPSFQRIYPYFQFERLGAGYLLLGLGVRLLGMLAWEFLLRGYVLFGFERRVGAAAAIAVQTIPFAIMHVGKPPLETYGSLVAGVVLGIVAVRARSVIPCAVLHWAVAATLDILALRRF